MTIGQQLIALKDASGVSLRDIAKAGGWAGASSVQKYFEPDYDRPLRPDVAARFAPSLGQGIYEPPAGAGTPTYSGGGISEIIALLRNTAIPADVRAAAAAEKLVQLSKQS